jgi:hypothetical protein
MAKHGKQTLHPYRSEIDKDVASGDIESEVDRVGSSGRTMVVID